MSLFERKKNFEEDTDILAEDFNEEFDAIEETLNGLFSAARVACSAELTLTGSYQDVPGASLTISPSTPSLLLVFANVDFESILSGTGEEKSTAVLNVDGSDRGEEIHSGFPLAAASSFVNTAGQNYCISLSAASHTIKLRAKHGGSYTGRVKATSTGFTYLLIPQP